MTRTEQNQFIDALIAHLAKVTAEEMAPSGFELTLELDDRRPDAPAPKTTTVDFELDDEIPF